MLSSNQGLIRGTRCSLGTLFNGLQSGTLRQIHSAIIFIYFFLLFFKGEISSQKNRRLCLILSPGLFFLLKLSVGKQIHLGGWVNNVREEYCVCCCDCFILYWRSRIRCCSARRWWGACLEASRSLISRRAYLSLGAWSLLWTSNGWPCRPSIQIFPGQSHRFKLCDLENSGKFNIMRLFKILTSGSLSRTTCLYFFTFRSSCIHTPMVRSSVLEKQTI